MRRTCLVIVNWNGLRYLPRSLAALQTQREAVQIIVVDNASSDGSVEYLRREHPAVRVIALDRNVGYAGGANLGIRATDARYVMVLNPDVVLEPQHAERLVDAMERDPSIGAAQGKLYQVAPDDYLAGRFPAEQIDSAGHAIRRSRMVVDIGQGEPDNGSFDEERSVFSACGAALLLRRAMLDDVAPDAEFFDEAFFAYKEDIDLCWRARLLGWDVRYIPSAVGHHVRGWAGGRPPPVHQLPLSVRRHSWLNHYLLILKNDDPENLLRAAPSIAWWEILRQGHAALRDQALYPTYRTLWEHLPTVRRQRAQVHARRRVTAEQMRRWFGEPRGLPPDRPPALGPTRS